jgi:hypothetical protein
MTENTEANAKAVAVCEGCGEYLPVQILSDGRIHPIGGHERDCPESSFRVLENATPPEFRDR